MSINIGIIGPSKSGKTTIFNALTRGKAETSAYFSGEAAKPNVGIAKVPDARLVVLTKMYNPKRVVPAEIKYIDLGASLKALVKEKGGIGGELLNSMQASELIINVIRGFENEAVPLEGGIDIGRDIAAMDLELAFSDLAMIERRVERLKVNLKSAKPPDRPGLEKELAIMEKFKSLLEAEKPIREIELQPDEARFVTNFQYLTAKPLLTIVNVGDDQASDQVKLEEELNKKYGRPNRYIIAVAGKLEMELGQMDEASAKEFRDGFGITESGLDRVNRAAYALLGLISFLTVGEDEVRAWPIIKGSVAQKAAGRIHTDIERGFIRAEVIGYDDLIKTGSMAEAKKKGLLRLEGKEYVVKDGDIINYLFNV